MSALRELSDLPAPPRLPLLGNAHQLFPVSRVLSQAERWSRRYGPIVRVDIGRRQMVGISDMDAINEILRERPHGFRRWREHEAISREMGATGVVVAEGEDWRRQRRLVVRALNTNHLQRYFHIVEAMRLKAVAPIATIESLQETTLCDTRIPAGTRLVLLLREAGLTDADREFDPDRWLDSRAPDQKTFLTFGAGPRFCPGRNRIVKPKRSLTVAYSAFDCASARQPHRSRPQRPPPRQPWGRRAMADGTLARSRAQAAEIASNRDEARYEDPVRLCGAQQTVAR